MWLIIMTLSRPINPARERPVATPGPPQKSPPLALISRRLDPSVTIRLLGLKQVNHPMYQRKVDKRTGRLREYHPDRPVGRKKGYVKTAAPYPADPDRLILCPDCNTCKPLKLFLDKLNAQQKRCRICIGPFLSHQAKSWYKRIKTDSKYAAEVLSKLPDIKDLHSNNIGVTTRLKIRRNRMLVYMGLKPKRVFNPNDYFRMRARFGYITEEEADRRIESWYERHPDQRPTADGVQRPPEVKEEV
jgi:hypothetical protein